MCSANHQLFSPHLPSLIFPQKVTIEHQATYSMCILIVRAELVRGCGQLKELKQTQLRKQKTASTWHAHHNILQALQQLCLPVRSGIMSMVSFGTHI